MEEQKKKVFEFLRGCTHGVISTVSKDSKPEGALVGFGEREDLTLIFGTETTMRKYKNIKTNPNISFTISDEEKATTVQYEGVVSEFSDDELKEYKKIYFTKTPSSQKFENAPNEIYLKVTPKWVRYTNYMALPPEIFEISL